MGLGLGLRLGLGFGWGMCLEDVLDIARLEAALLQELLYVHGDLDHLREG